MGLTLEAGINDFLHKKQNFSDALKGKSLLMLGNQVICLNAAQLFLIADYMQIDIDEGKVSETSDGNVDSISFFKCLGIEDIRIMDINSYEGADIIFDLNSNVVPDELYEKFDIIVDGGTLEHIFHIPNALQNLANLLRTEGEVYHYLPLSGWINHGYYSFSPSILNDFYQVNGFQVLESNIVLRSPRFTPDHGNGMPLFLEDCLSTAIDYRMVNLMDQKFDLLHEYKGNLRCIAKKTRRLSSTTLPIQRHWYMLQAKHKAMVKGLNLFAYKEKEILIWGMGDVANKFINIIDTAGVPREKIMGVISNNKDINDFHGFEILSCEDFRTDNKPLLVIIASFYYEEEIYRKAKEIFGEHAKLVKLSKYKEFF